MSLTLLDPEGATSTAELAEAPSFTKPTEALRSRVAYAAAHVVPKVWADNTPGRPAEIDSDSTWSVLTPTTTEPPSSRATSALRAINSRVATASRPMLRCAVSIASATPSPHE